jgi:2-polyprenyl-6-methoxyphenol hydroxylase-like FAD-dependent oxidoreductase
MTSSLPVAGLGLCLAQGLRKAGQPFLLFERDERTDTRKQGYRLRIDAAGQEALALCLPVDLLYLVYQTASLADPKPRFVDRRALIASATAPGSWATGDAGLPDLCVNRQTLEEILRCGLEGQMHHGRALNGFEEKPDGIVVRLDDGTEVTGAVLVGADAAGASVRRQIAPVLEPEDNGMVCLYGRTPATAANCATIGRDLCAGTSIVLDDEFTAIIDVMTFHGPLSAIASQIAPDCQLSPVDDHFYWALTGPRGWLAHDSAGGPADIVWKLVRGWAPALQAIILRSDPADWSIHPIRSLDQRAAIGGRRVALLGDAAHVMSPAGGLGASTTLQDAADLVAHIVRDRRAGREIDLTEYDSMMRDRAIGAGKASSDASHRLATMMAA